MRDISNNYRVCVYNRVSLGKGLAAATADGVEAGMPGGDACGACRVVSSALHQRATANRSIAKTQPNSRTKA